MARTEAQASSGIDGKAGQSPKEKRRRSLDDARGEIERIVNAEPALRRGIERMRTLIALNATATIFCAGRTLTALGADQWGTATIMTAMTLVCGTVLAKRHDSWAAWSPPVVSAGLLIALWP